MPSEDKTVGSRQLAVGKFRSAECRVKKESGQLANFLVLSAERKY